MPSLLDALGPEIANLGELIGILTSGGDFDGIWFSDVLNQLERMPRRLAELLTLIDRVMGPALYGNCGTGHNFGQKNPIQEQERTSLCAMT
jgi:hypothetical protein